MCGVFGYIGKPTKQTIKAIYLLGRLNEERGKDSTGLVISNGKEFSFHKDAKIACEFFKDPEAIKLLNKYKKDAFINVIGHTRQATRGVVSKENAHPFQIGKIIMAHNGIIHNFDKLQSDYKTSYSVDSQIIGYLLNTVDPIKVFEKKLGGWFTVPFLNMENQYQLNIAKHDTPLALAVMPDGLGMYYSSLESHLKKALNTVGIKVGVGDTGGSKLYTFSWVDGKLKREKVKIENKVTYSYGDMYKSYYMEEDGYGCSFRYENGGYEYNLKQLEAPKSTVTKISDIVKKRKEDIEKVYEVEKDGRLKRVYC